MHPAATSFSWRGNYFVGVQVVDWLFNTTPEDTDPPHILLNKLDEARIMVTNAPRVDRCGWGKLDRTNYAVLFATDQYDN